jgi:hypothetical protein
MSGLIARLISSSLVNICSSLSSSSPLLLEVIKCPFCRRSIAAVVCSFQSLILLLFSLSIGPRLKRRRNNRRLYPTPRTRRKEEEESGTRYNVTHNDCAN